MSMINTITEYGGSTKASSELPVKVSYWHIPGGTDYTNAQVRHAYFPDVEKAEKFCKDFDPPPEMASIDSVNGQLSQAAK